MAPFLSGSAHAGFYEAPAGPCSSMYTQASANHLHYVESDIPEGSIIYLGCFLRFVYSSLGENRDGTGPVQMIDDHANLLRFAVEGGRERSFHVFQRLARKT